VCDGVCVGSEASMHETSMLAATIIGVSSNAALCPHSVDGGERCARAGAATNSQKSST
jgi:hypothetical protein